VCDDFNRAGIPTDLSERIESSLWGKILYNCSLNALGAILNVPYGHLGEVPEIRGAMERIIEEIFAVARAKGVPMMYSGPGEYFGMLMDRLLPPTATHRSSMLQDIEGGRKTEIDALNGAIARYGRELSVPTPVNETITAIIKGIEAKKTPPS
jgi:2-dehydropantoate 2-reductase